MAGIAHAAMAVIAADAEHPPVATPPAVRATRICRATGSRGIAVGQGVPERVAVIATVV
ncbi:hypothetical protein ACWESP_31970 [Nocardia beijingensis]